MPGVRSKRGPVQAALVGSMGIRPHKNATCARNRPTASLKGKPCCGTPTGRADEDDGSLSRLGAWTGRGLSKTAHSDPFASAVVVRLRPYQRGNRSPMKREERERDRHIDLSNAAFSRAAICSTLVTVPATISSSQHRPRAIDATSVARVSARTGVSWSPENSPQSAGVSAV
jgi:hypothetical protein